MNFIKCNTKELVMFRTEERDQLSLFHQIIMGIIKSSLFSIAFWIINYLDGCKNFLDYQINTHSIFNYFQQKSIFEKLIVSLFYWMKIIIRLVFSMNNNHSQLTREQTLQGFQELINFIQLFLYNELYYQLIMISKVINIFC